MAQAPKPSVYNADQNIDKQIDEQIDKLGRVIAGQTIQERGDLNADQLVAVPVDAIPMNIPLPCTLIIRVAGKFVVFRPQGEKFTPKRALALQQKGADSLYIHKAAWKVFLEALEKLQLPAPITPESASQHLRNLLVSYGMELERKIKEPKKPIFDNLQKLCDSLTSLIRSNPGLGTKLLRKNDNPQLAFITHSVNVAIYAAVISFKAGFTLEQMQEVAFAAFLHDIGKLLLPKGLLLKQTPTPDEEKIIEGHTRLGAELLQSIGLPPSIVLTALQHHERMDGKGYPAGLQEADIHDYARICSIADAYEALTSNRPTRAALSPSEALAKMRSLEGKFDLRYLGT